MKAKIDNFAKTNKLTDCSFSLMKTLGGDYYLNTILPNTSKGSFIYSYNEASKLDSFLIKNTKKPYSRYTTFKGFINRIEKEL